MRARTLPVALFLLSAFLIPEGAPAQVPPVPQFLVGPYLQLPAPTAMTVMWETDFKAIGQVEYGATPDLGQSAREREAGALHEVRLVGLRPGTKYFYRVRSGPLTSATYSFRTAPPPGTRRWRMALYGDSRSNPSTHRRVAEQIAKANVDLIVHTGDIVLNGKNHASWRREFFEPLGEMAHSVPWVSTIGNHERDADNYFSYMALPGNERYFGFDFANAHIVCLDSNAWIEKGRDSFQYGWLTHHLAEKRDATWTFVVFHHPLFSAHATRPINALRWEWAPVFLDPANRVDGVLTGHDHFYARNYRMSRLGDKPPVLFLTSAGGGASLYRIRERDYVAVAKSVHHFVLFEFDGERVTLSAIGVAGGLGSKIETGQVFDRFVLTKEASPAEDTCVFEIEDLRQLLRQALVAAKPVPLGPAQETSRIDTTLRVPTHFRVPVRGEMIWENVPGWKMKQAIVPFLLAPGQPLEIPLQADVDPGAFARTPKLTLAFAGQFHNRCIDLHPCKLAGPSRAVVGRAATPLVIDGRLEAGWQSAPSQRLLGLPPLGGRADEVRFLADDDWLYVAARLDDPAGTSKVKPPDPDAEPTSFVLYQEHFRMETWDGKHRRVFALSPEQLRYCACDREEDEKTRWRAAAAQLEGAWSVEMALPRRLFPDLTEVQINVVHRRRIDKDVVDFQLCPSYKLGPDPDRLPDWKMDDRAEPSTRLSLAGS
jgi:hypothetical protein